MMLQVSTLNTKDKHNTNAKNMKNIPEAIQMSNWLHKADPQAKNSTNQQELYQNGIIIKVKRDEKSGNVVVQINAYNIFGTKYRGATVCIGDHFNNLYDYKYINEKKTEAVFYFPKNNPHEYKLAIVKEGIVGFDEFYRLRGDKLMKTDIDEHDVNAKKNRRSAEPIQNQPELSFEKRKSSSFDNVNKKKNRKQKQNQVHETIKKSRND